MTEPRAPRNQTMRLTADDRVRLKRDLLTTHKAAAHDRRRQEVALGDFNDWLGWVAESSVDLLFLDPPYNLPKSFNGRKFSRRTEADYTTWLSKALKSMLPYLKATATVYICGDWRTSHSIYEAASNHLKIRNRITWEREKGRGSKRNWKNTSEDIWFCTISNDYYFDPNAVKVRRRVIAPYTDSGGQPKDWQQTPSGRFRDTCPSNLWTDISIPFWSMPENTDHPTQKSEKSLAKLLLASTRPDDFVLDPFLGSGTTLAVCKKLGRRGFGIELDPEYCLLSLLRLEKAAERSAIQGYQEGVFWERNTQPPQTEMARHASHHQQTESMADELRS